MEVNRKDKENGQVIFEAFVGYAKNFCIDENKLIVPGFTKIEYPGITYNLNLDGYRSENFQNFVQNSSALFAGCSVTFGEALDENVIWPKLVYDQLLNDKFCFNGYFNLGVPGLAIPEIIVNCFKFFKLYGNPKYLFICFPNILRGIDGNGELAKIRAFQFYNILEMYCEIFNIKLFSFTWSHDDKNFTLNELFKNKKTFYPIDKELWQKKLYEEYENGHINMYAADNLHPGTGFHQVVSKFVIENIFNDKKNN